MVRLDPNARARTNKHEPFAVDTFLQWAPFCCGHLFAVGTLCSGHPFAVGTFLLQAPQDSQPVIVGRRRRTSVAHLASPHQRSHLPGTPPSCLQSRKCPSLPHPRRSQRCCLDLLSGTGGKRGWPAPAGLHSQSLAELRGCCVGSLLCFIGAILCRAHARPSAWGTGSHLYKQVRAEACCGPKTNAWACSVMPV